MTDPTPYTDDNVRRLVALIDEGQYHDPAIHPGSTARRLLAAGVTLPPEPDTPPEAEERFRVSRVADQGEMYVLVDDGPDPGPHSGATVGERSVTDRAARLLNLDAKYEDQGGVAKALESLTLDRDGCHNAAGMWREQLSTCLLAKATVAGERDEARAELERLTAEVAEARGRADAFQAKFEEQCQRGDDLFTGRYEAIQRAVTAEAELEDARAELIREREDRDLERDLFAARVKELEAERLPAAVPQDDGPTEPLFTGRMCFTAPEWPDVTVTIDGPHEGWAGQDVDVYPAGVRPAAPAQAVTAEMVEQAVFNSVLNDDPPSEWNGDEWGEVTSRINDQLGRTVAWAPPEAGR